MDNWSRLNSELKLKILSHVPTSRQKFALRFVDKSWPALLDSPQAHDGEEGDPLKGVFNVPTQLWKHVKVLNISGDCAYNLTERQFLVLLGAAARLEELRLTVSSTSSLDALPYFANLRVLCMNIEDQCSQAVRLAPTLLPNLEELIVTGGIIAVGGLCADLDKFSELKDVYLSFRGGESWGLNYMSPVTLPAVCKLSLNWQHVVGSMAGQQLPVALCNAVRMVSIQGAGPCFSLNFLSSCSNLRVLGICVTEEVLAVLEGADILPASLQNMFVQCEVMPSVSSEAISLIRPQGNEGIGFWSGYGKDWTYVLNPNRLDRSEDEE